MHPSISTKTTPRVKDGSILRPLSRGEIALEGFDYRDMPMVDRLMDTGSLERVGRRAGSSGALAQEQRRKERC